ncbi:hypothetical protein C0991_002987 [Blastosporella zonata]|nr:hypothetical protein C0991_002987 [Blastosporella zonata]
MSKKGNDDKFYIDWAAESKKQTRKERDFATTFNINNEWESTRHPRRSCISNTGREIAKVADAKHKADAKAIAQRDIAKFEKEVKAGEARYCQNAARPDQEKKGPASQATASEAVISNIRVLEDEAAMERQNVARPDEEKIEGTASQATASEAVISNIRVLEDEAAMEDDNSNGGHSMSPKVQDGDVEADREDVRFSSNDEDENYQPSNSEEERPPSLVPKISEIPSPGDEVDGSSKDELSLLRRRISELEKVETKKKGKASFRIDAQDGTDTKKKKRKASKKEKEGQKGKEPKGKGLKHAVSGLKTNWKQHLALKPPVSRNKRQLSSPKPSTFTDDTRDDTSDGLSLLGGGEFDEDEPAEQLGAARWIANYSKGEGSVRTENGS